MSAILSADDLNDFISPGVACIKPVETLPKQDDSNPYEVTTEDKVQAQNPAPASISLTDCLACSGCVTSAEAVLVSLQSHTEVLNTLDAHPSLDISHALGLQNGALNDHSTLDDNTKVFVASVSPQVRASIAATYGITERRAGYMIEQFLSGSQGLRIGGQHKSGFSYVVDTNRMREACLVLGADEVGVSESGKAEKRPVLTSACPGWVCYAEKTHPHVLPHLSTLKSPQALTGTLLKSVLSKSLGIHPSKIWHLAIMPCFDKKLEASREELTHKWWSDDEQSNSVRDVDCVITSRELLTLAEARGVQLSSLPQTPVPQSRRSPFPDRKISDFLLGSRHRSLASEPQSPDSGTSGGYLYHILRTHQSRHPGSTITVQRGRNTDVTEYTLNSPTSPSTPILKCARYYGFRNIQNLVRKLKPAKQSRLPGAANRRNLAGNSNIGAGTDYAYVEVMACPGGCTNGGGQIKIEDVAHILPETRGEQVDINKLRTPQSQKEWLARIDEAYYSAESDLSSTEDDTSNHNDEDFEMADVRPEPEELIINGISHTRIYDILSHWSDITQIPLDRLTTTSYRKVESDVGKEKKVVSKKKMGDSERIAAIAGLEGGGW